MHHESFLQVSAKRETASAPHSRSCSFKNRPRPKLELDFTETRPRTNSVPNCPVYLSLPDGIHGDFSGKENRLCRVRSFKTTSKGVVNHGDSFKHSSENSLMSAGSTVTDVDNEKQRHRNHSVASDESAAHSGGSSIAPSYFRVVMLGANGVGKTNLCRQFMTSECMGPYEATSPDCEEPQSTVSVLLDGEESMMEVIDDAQLSECEDLLVDAYVVVFSIADHSSFSRAISIVRNLRVDMGTDRAVILVANKIDLVRQRRVTSNEARVIAMKYDCKYIETSVALNHHVDELVVGILSQIRLKLQPQTDEAFQPEKPKEKSSPKKAMSFICRLFKHASRKYKSCDDLLAC